MTVTAEEMQRRLAEVLARFEELANRLDLVYVRRDVFDAYKELQQTRLDAAKAEREALEKQLDTERGAYEKRLQILEDDKTAKGRLVWGSFISAIGAILVAVILAIVLHHGGTG